MVNEQYSECWYEKVCSGSDVSEKAEHCTKLPSCVKYMEMKYLIEESGIPKAKQRPIVLSAEDVDYSAFLRLSEIKDDIESFVSNGTNLYIVSKNTGNGKTSWAIKLMLRYFDRIWSGNGFNVRGYFIHVPTLLLRLKDFGNKDPELSEIKKILVGADLVIWDDIGSLGMSNYDLSQLLMYLDQRIITEKANIFTGNLMEDDLEHTLGTRLFSRIWNTSEHIILYGKDRRGINGTNSDTFKNLTNK